MKKIPLKKLVENMNEKQLIRLTQLCPEAKVELDEQTFNQIITELKLMVK